ncbi:hypothetical protein [Cereibacter changlensis]|nr:hypothetical protein [Cereibacter changlensis]
MMSRYSAGESPPDIRALLNTAKAQAASERSARREAEALLLNGARAKMRKRQMRERLHSYALIAIIAVLWGLAVLVSVRGDFLPKTDVWRDYAKPRNS